VSGTLQEQLIWHLYDLHWLEIADSIEDCQMAIHRDLVLVECSVGESLGIIAFPLQP
jgi:hypothetical protein